MLGTILLHNHPDSRRCSIWFKVALTGLLLLLPLTANAQCRDNLVDLRWEGGSARFTVEIADTAVLRGRGLMHRKQLAPYAGMLFIYPEAARVSFWMTNTLIPLDMIFINPQGLVTRISENAIPGDQTPIPGGDGIIEVLEINGGMADRLGLKAGAHVRHPSFNQDTSVWPCTS